MTVRDLRYALKTLVGPWAVIPVAVLETMNLLQRGMPWRGEALWTVDWFAIALFIVGPLLAGAAAVDAANLSRVGNIHLVLATAQPHRPYLRAAAWCAIPVLVVHVLTMAAGLAVGGLYGDPQWLGLAGAALVQCLAICWYVAIGSAVGRLAGPLVAGAVAAVGSFTLIYLFAESDAEGFAPLALGGATVSRLGLEYSPAYLLAQVAVFVLTGAAFLLLPVRLRSGRKVLTTAGAVAVALTAVLFVGGRYALPETRLVARPVAPAACVGSAPEVCLYPEHQRLHDQILQHVRILSEGARSKGYDALVPGRIEELSRTYSVSNPDIVGLEMPSDAYATGRVSVEEVASSMVRPLHCSEFYDEAGPQEAYWAREFSLLYTLLSAAGVRLDTAEFPVEPRILTPEQVEDIMDDYAVCDLEGE
ncbi:hypothetical protein [Streptomyces europaeiscabiei]|uniref:hypothetical protein n=1 Tax=Streptomyces europaeiscabiei TaxID=146819 RepID=UPI002E16217B|nr:hypothetical protein OHB30_22175 [Streptomyces europaeiscabiei]